MGLDKYIPGSAQGVLANPLVIDITYAELVDKISLSALIPGQKYRITDYRTAYNMPNVTPAEKIVCTVEPLLVTANSANTLSMYAYSEAYPQDEIYYNPTSDQAMVPGCDMGYIYRRVDKLKSIDIGFDWRNVKFRRWQISVTDEDATGAVSDYTKYAVVKKTGTAEIYIKLNDNTACLFTSTNDWKRYEFDNLLFVSPTPTEFSLCDGELKIPCTIEYLDYYIFNGSAHYNVQISQNSSDIISKCSSVFLGDSYNNIIGIEFLNNTIGGDFHNNRIGNCFQNNSIGNLFIYNTIAEDFIGNTIKGSFSRNIIAPLFQSNVIGVGTENNTIAGDFYNNTIAGDFYKNTIAGAFYSNIIIRNFRKNDIGQCVLMESDLTLATIVYEDYGKKWNITPSGTVAYYYDATNKIILFNPVTDAILSVKEYTALISETGYAATSGLLISGQTYYIASYVAGDDFTNVGGTNVTGNTFVASGTTPTTWTNSSILVSVGISAPAVTLLNNGLSGAIVWTYSAVGTYIGTLSGAFTENKTVFSYPPLGNDKAVTVEWTSANVITVKTYETGALKDGLLVKFPLTIKVYP